MITNKFCTRKRSCVRLVDVQLPVWSIRGRCSGRFVCVQRVGKGELVAFHELKKSQFSVIGVSFCKICILSLACLPESLVKAYIMRMSFFGTLTIML
ncbi:hypothetical protein DPMN_137120 [Dreissena polymorpha]|uniref:Uncharacterized protein n=1 Tax=Dreissena polymorpha TaxID=45954 RepID=A0A9D4JII8_DREPO|nr:hypothetical protein DPMN_137120 [Dreissena polymorpha]